VYYRTPSIPTGIKVGNLINIFFNRNFRKVMKLDTISIKLVTVAISFLAGIIPMNPAKAIYNTFGEQNVDQNRFIAVAVPFGDYGNYNLLIVEQIPGKTSCWRESGDNPVTVEPLLLNFDFTGHCNRSSDSNGYSVRIEGQDYGLDYLLRIVKRDGELQLIATPRSDRTQPEIFIGRSYGMNDGLVKIFLNPGWNFTKRTYQNKALGHVYFSNHQKATGVIDEGYGQRNTQSQSF
jgi:N-acetylmuramoyl-L-alanine amidase